MRHGGEGSRLVVLILRPTERRAVRVMLPPAKRETEP